MARPTARQAIAVAAVGAAGAAFLAGAIAGAPAPPPGAQGTALAAGQPDPRGLTAPLGSTKGSLRMLPEVGDEVL